MYCPECGSEITDQAAYCPECGTDLGTGPGAEPVGQQGSKPAQHSHAHDGRTDRESRGEGTSPPLTAAVSVSGGLLRGLGTFISAFTLTAAVLGYEVWTYIDSTPASAGTPGGATLEQTAQAVGAGVAFGGAAVAQNVFVIIVKLVGWIFFNAHQVAIVGTGTATASTGTQTATQSVNILSQMETMPNAPLTPIFYYVIPPLLLAYGGYRLSRRAKVESPILGLLPGASIALGYVPLAYGFAIFASFSPGMTTTATASASIGPDPMTAALMAGGYAVVCGAIGGGLAGLVGS